jgi:hypothetical protein
VDKTIFLHSLNGLRVFEGPVQALFLQRMLTGQKTGSAQAGQFRTFNPVDMHGFIHSPAVSGLLTRIPGGEMGLAVPVLHGQAAFISEVSERPVRQP